MTLSLVCSDPLAPSASGIMLGEAGPAGRAWVLGDATYLSLARVPTVWVVSAEARAWAALGVELGLFCRDDGVESAWMIGVKSLPRSLSKNLATPQVMSQGAATKSICDSQCCQLTKWGKEASGHNDSQWRLL